jgi:hypothetical protein
VTALETLEKNRHTRRLLLGIMLFLALGTILYVAFLA